MSIKDEADETRAQGGSFWERPGRFVTMPASAKYAVGSMPWLQPLIKTGGLRREPERSTHPGSIGD